MKFTRFQREDGLTVLELLIALALCGALVAILIPVYNGARANALADSVEDSVRGTASAITQDVLVTNYGAFNERTLPAKDIVRIDGATVIVTGQDGSGDGSAALFEVRAWNPAAAKYKSPQDAYVYNSVSRTFVVSTGSG